MSRKVRQEASLKISKNEKQVHSLIKVLRPKLYIIDSSNFKRLVQELTGNISPYTSPPTKPDLDLEEHDKYKMEASFEPLDSCGLYAQAALDDEFNQIYNQVNLNYSTLEHSTGDLESWLSEMEPYPPMYNDYAEFEQEVSIYDYELSGLI
ncbi:hypothetical protein I3760_04G137600 [Carya illinoinensis]|uniref:VQ domain-containing protein n=1 Tax=Carya illinoinensis TaxID=32201 RepID=A0A922FDS5_CARIL|nr:hypothetical protein I3760_04G137600 [Carya illinoinensis]KAG6718172.1 hypothetical protein I3842_04G137400 [Carya illinoinensis]